MTAGATPIPLANGLFQIDSRAATRVVEPESARRSGRGAGGSISELLRQRFAEPLEFPPILQSTIADDRIAIAVACGTPLGMEIAALIAGMLVDDGHAPEKISVLLTTAPHSPHQDSEKFRWSVYDPAEPNDSAWLMAGLEDHSISVSRCLFDADLIIAVGSFYGPTPRDAISPAFCSVETREHLAGLRPADANRTISMIDDQLGIFWQVCVLPGPGNEIVDILAGERSAVLRRGIQIMEGVWRATLRETEPLVIATIEDDESLAPDVLDAALRNAHRAVSPGGAIVLIARGLRKVLHGYGREIVLPRLERVHRTNPLYLGFEGDSARMDDGDITCIADSSELCRLIVRYESAVLLRDAHKLDLQVGRGEAQLQNA